MLAGYLYIASAAILFGIAGAASKYLFIHHMGPLDLTILRNVVACLIFVLIIYGLKFKATFRKNDIVHYLVVGILMTAVNYTFFLAIALNGVAVALILQYTAPVFVTLVEVSLGLAVLTRHRITTIVVALGGCFLLVRGYDSESFRGNLTGVAVGVLSGLVFGLYNMAVNVSHKRGVDDRALVLSSFVVSSAILLAFAPSMTVSISDLGLDSWMFILFISALATVLPYWLFVIGLKVVPPFQATVISILDPLAAAIVAALLLGERLELLQIAGVVLVLGSVVFAPMGESGKLGLPSRREVRLLLRSLFGARLH
ncbi:DMT family transporter [Bradyrhizobium prioriisuperbiae]|uniref:DMT family transporter n=1 Tax=Bradyrhizobium prioriisuperbiae TaxID=2854389 RepID=UPI0028EFD431|nr:DMT family transporter [Bradyrhizobium prioritasuperba]